MRRAGVPSAGGTSVQLIMPEQRPLPGVDVRPRPLRAWLAALPYVDAESTARAALERLRDINQQTLPAAQRLELLAAFRHCYARLHEPLSSGGPQQDPAAPTPALALLAEFTETLSHGYKYALRDAIAENPRWGRAKLLAGAAHYTLHLLAQLLLCRYQTYQPVAAQHWREIGELVRFAETERLPALRDSEFPYSTGELHALGAYRQLALLRLADPYRLPPGLVWEAYGYIAAKSAQIELLLHYDEALPTGVYGLPLDQEPHHSLPAPTSGIERNTWRWLDARELLRNAQLDLDRIVSGTLPQRLDFSNRVSSADALQLLGRMLGQWTHSPQRKAPRFNSNQKVDVVPGLDAAYYFLNHCTAFDPALYAPPENEDDIDFSRVQRRAPDVRRSFRLVGCPTRNRSSGGLSLHVDALSELSLRVGQLVLLAPSEGGGPGQDWLIGVVRWLVSRTAGTELGVQYVGRNPVPVAVRPVAGAALQNAHPALRSDLPLADGQRLLTLITQRGLFRAKAVLELHQAGQVRQLRCSHLLESGQGFERFSYELLN